MSRSKARPLPENRQRLTTELTTCPACGRLMPVAYTKGRTVMTLAGLVLSVVIQ